MLPNGSGIKAIKGHPGLLRLRAGNYRIIYLIDNGKLTIYAVDAGNRGKICNRY